MIAFAFGIGSQGVDDVGFILACDFWNVIARVGVLVFGDAMASRAGIRQGFSILRIACGECIATENTEYQSEEEWGFAHNRAKKGSSGAIIPKIHVNQASIYDFRQIRPV
jgi:hypothetical protein